MERPFLCPPGVHRPAGSVERWVAQPPVIPWGWPVQLRHDAPRACGSAPPPPAQLHNLGGHMTSQTTLWGAPLLAPNPGCAPPLSRLARAPAGLQTSRRARTECHAPDASAPSRDAPSQPPAGTASSTTGSTKPNAAATTSAAAEQSSLPSARRRPGKLKQAASTAGDADSPSCPARPSTSATTTTTGRSSEAPNTPDATAVQRASLPTYTHNHIETPPRRLASSGGLAES